MLQVALDVVKLVGGELHGGQARTDQRQEIFLAP
jgi:hypothetical protein